MKKQADNRRNVVAQPWAEAFYHSKKWEKTREWYMSLPIETDRGICPPDMCERCWDMGVLKPANTVHHKEWLTPLTINDPNKTLSASNLMRVCMDCHAALHSGCDDVPRVAFDEEGNVIPLG